MTSFRKTIFRALVGIVGLIVLIGGGLLLFGMVTEFRPDPVVPVTITGMPSRKLDPEGVFSLVTWNIGYGGLGKEMDFFYDGGKQVRPEQDCFNRTVDTIGNFLRRKDSVDFFLLQEVDRGSRRSWFLDEMKWLTTLLPGFCIAYASNYDCRFVPVPVTNPMGRVISGVVTCSRFRPEEAVRHGFDRHVPWPGRVFDMKRCFLVLRYPLPDGHQLVLVNIHNSAFDTGGVLRTREMEMITQFLVTEYQSGNYLVAGGDWNANPPGFKPEEVVTENPVKRELFQDLASFVPGWEFVFDPAKPTNRNLDQAYQPGITPVTIIDFFLVSPNVWILDVHTVQTNFEASDHQPVMMQFSLIPYP